MKKYFKFNSISIGIIILSILFFSCEKKETTKEINMKEVKKMEKEFSEFVKKFEAKIKPLDHEEQLTYFEASVSGDDNQWNKFTELDKKRNELFANKDDFSSLKKMKESGLIQDDLIKRHLDILYNAFLGNQIDTAKLNAMSELQTQITKTYNTFRAQVSKKKLTDNDVEEILKTSKDSKKLKETWLAHKKIGPIVSKDVLKLVKMRNEAAKELGFNNFHEMSLKLNEQDPAEIEKLFDELDVLTRDAFINVKKDMDSVLASQLKIKPEELMPWHYQNRYFQEAPKIYEVDLDIYYKDKNIEELTKTYYDGIGFIIDNLLTNSDLYEKEKKNQHAYCITIDRDKKDVRVLCNIKSNASWMGTMLHEFGHAIYDKYIDSTLPWAMKEPAHIFTTEGIAMLFERFASNPQWMHDMINLSKEEQDKIIGTCKRILRLEKLVFSRWAQVMYRFEKSMYANPDQDLNKLWWDLVEKYQMIKKPVGRNEPDWASKIHIASSPCYYHNYLLGDLFASQLSHYLNQKLLKNPKGVQSDFIGNKEVGKYLIENVFKPGKRYLWNDMIEKATGEKLIPKYYADQFVK